MSNFSLASNGASSGQVLKFKPKTGNVIEISSEHACLSSVIKSMIGDLSDVTGEIPLPDVDRETLEVIAKSLPILGEMKERGRGYPSNLLKINIYISNFLKITCKVI